MFGGRHIVANMLEYGSVESEFDLKLCYYVHFQTYTLGKGMNSLIPSDMLNSTTTILLSSRFGL